MRIESAQIQLSSGHFASERHVRQETLEAGFTAPGNQVGGERVQMEDVVELNGNGGSEPESLLDRFLDGRSIEEVSRPPAAGPTQGRMVSLADAGESSSVLETLRQSALASVGIDVQVSEAAGALAVEEADELGPTSEDETKIEMIVSMIERLTGKKVKILSPEEYLEARENAAGAPPPDAAAQPESSGAAQAEAGPQFSLRYTSHELHEEQEATYFKAQGVVKTADGQEIAVDIEMGMSRSFREEVTETVEIGAALKDPLVVNFSGTAAELTERTFRFDLDRDGAQDEMHFVTGSSGFLTIDRNGDGAVNDGGELFGATSGDGFAELAAYDDDGNGFIDEGDAVYDGLRIWTKDGAGNDQLFALGEKDVGAIYLGKTATPFDLKSSENELQGQVRSTGFYLGESGGAGTVQQLDLVI